MNRGVDYVVGLPGQLGGGKKAIRKKAKKSR